jgi:hypothetical protein
LPPSFSGSSARHEKYAYRRTKDENGLSSIGREACPFNRELDNFLITQPASIPPHITEARVTAADEEQEFGKYFLLIV